MLLHKYLILAIFCCTSAFAQNTILSVYAKAGCVSISLDANPTTGYQWKVEEYPSDLLTLSKETYRASESSQIGGGGQAIFEFKVKAQHPLPKKTTITFIYQRPWKNSDPVKTTTVTVYFNK